MLLSRAWLLALLALVFGALIAYQFAVAGRWFGMAMFGVVFPVGALLDWGFARSRSASPRDAADRVLLSVVLALLAMLVVVDRGQERERALLDECRGMHVDSSD